MRCLGRARAVAVRAYTTIVSLRFSSPMNGVELRTAADRPTPEARDPRAYVSLGQDRDGLGQDRDGIVQGLLLEAVDGIRQATGLVSDAEARTALNA